MLRAFADKPVSPTAPAPAPVETRPQHATIGHGIEDLSPQEQERYKNRPRVTIEVPKVQQQFVRVPGPDYEAQGYRDAIAREASNNPQFASVLHRITEGAKLVADGLRTNDRWHGSSQPAAEIIA